MSAPSIPLTFQSSSVRGSSFPGALSDMTKFEDTLVYSHPELEFAPDPLMRPKAVISYDSETHELQFVRNTEEYASEGGPLIYTCTDDAGQAEELQSSCHYLATNNHSCVLLFPLLRRAFPPVVTVSEIAIRLFLSSFLSLGP